MDLKKYMDQVGNAEGLGPMMVKVRLWLCLREAYALPVRALMMFPDLLCCQRIRIDTE